MPLFRNIWLFRKIRAAILASMKVDGFLVGIAIALALAFAAPGVGLTSGPLHMGLLTSIGVGVVFFLHGAAVSRDALKSAAANWRLHIFVHTVTFIVFPAIGFAVFFGMRGLLTEELRLGFFYLCALSSTISSSVAMTAMGNGNVPGAMFDATLSGLLGMVLTPLLLGAVTATGASSVPVLPQITSIFIKLLAPFAIGQLLSPVLNGLLTRHKGIVSKADRFVIIMIVYTAFCDAAAGGVWTRHNLFDLIKVLALVGVLLGLVLTSAIFACRALHFSHEDEVAAVFCGATKSLANGAPIAKVIFGASPMLSIILLPLLFYHQMQLIACSFLARRYAARAAAQPVLAEAPKPAARME